MHSLLCSLKAGIREQPLIACPCCRPCRSVDCVWLNCLSLLLYMAALSDGCFLFFLVFLHVIFWEKPRYSGGFKLLFEGHCVHISKQAGFGNTPDWNAMISPPLLWLLGSRRRDARSEVLPQRPGLSRRARCENTKSNSQFPCVCQLPPSKPPAHHIPPAFSSHSINAWLKHCWHFKVTRAQPAQIVCGGPLSSLVCNCACFIPICLKESKPRTRRPCRFVLSRLTRFSRRRSQTWIPPVVVLVCSVYRNICIYRQLTALPCGLLNVQISLAFY